MARSYLRLDPHFYERKALRQGYPLGAVAALVGCLCLAETQPERGRFRDRRVLSVLLGPGAKWVPYLIERGDLIEQDVYPRLYIDGWDEWQEGDVTVSVRMNGIAARRGGSYGATPGALRQAQYRERSRIYERDHFTCRYCGNGQYPREWLVLDHVIPDGPSTDDNLVTACRSCNKLKGNRTAEEAGLTLRDVSVTVTGGVTRDTVEAEAVGGDKGGGGVTRSRPTNGYRREPERLPGEAPTPRHEGQHPDCFVCGTATVTPAPKPSARPRSASGG